MSKSNVTAAIALACLMVVLASAAWSQDEEYAACVDACQQTKAQCIDACDLHENPVECDEDCQEAAQDCAEDCR